MGDAAIQAKNRHGCHEVAPAFGVRGACSRFRTEGTHASDGESAGKPDALQTLRAMSLSRYERLENMKLEASPTWMADPGRQSLRSFALGYFRAAPSGRRRLGRVGSTGSQRRRSGKVPLPKRRVGGIFRAGQNGLQRNWVRLIMIQPIFS